MIVLEIVLDEEELKDREINELLDAFEELVARRGYALDHRDYYYA